MIARILLFGVPFLLVNLALDLYVWRHFRLGFPHWSPARRRRVSFVYGVLQASWYVTLPLLGAWGYESLPAWFRNTFQTYVLMAVASKVWALPWWFLQDLKGLCNKGFLKRLRPVPSHSVHSGNQDDGPDNTMDLSTPEGGEAEPLTRAAFLSRLGFLLGSVPLLGLGGSALSGTAYRYQVHRIKISLPGLAPSWLGKRIVQISDLHTGSWDSREGIERGMDLLKSLNPDVIFFTGDLVNTRTLEIMPWMDLLAQIQAPLGVYSILGNHDYGDYTQWGSEADKEANFEAMIVAHKALGWKLLRNEWLPVSNEAGDILQVVGSENWGKRSGFGKQYGNIVQATQGLRTDSPTVLLTHDPSHFDLEVLGKFPFIGLTLCGHTHGMQMGIDIPGLPRWSPASWVYPHWAGHYVFGAQQLYVNRGFGFVGFRGRIGIYPEITCFEFDNSLAYTPKAANETT